MFKPRLWSEKNYFSTPPYQSFLIPTPRDLIIRTSTSATSATSGHLEKEFNSTSKYAAMATPTQQSSYKQGCGVRVPGVACVKSYRSTFFRFDKVRISIRSFFLFFFFDSIKLKIGFLIAFGDFDLR